MLLIKTNHFPIAVVESLALRGVSAVARLSDVPRIAAPRGGYGTGLDVALVALTSHSRDNRY
jgi:hypothetical protein